MYLILLKLKKKILSAEILAPRSHGVTLSTPCEKHRISIHISSEMFRIAIHGFMIPNISFATRVKNVKYDSLLKQHVIKNITLIIIFKIFDHVREI